MGTLKEILEAVKHCTDSLGTYLLDTGRDITMSLQEVYRFFGHFFMDILTQLDCHWGSM